MAMVDLSMANCWFMFHGDVEILLHRRCLQNPNNTTASPRFLALFLGEIFVVCQAQSPSKTRGVENDVWNTVSAMEMAQNVWAFKDGLIEMALMWYIILIEMVKISMCFLWNSGWVFHTCFTPVLVTFARIRGSSHPDPVMFQHGRKANAYTCRILCIYVHICMQYIHTYIHTYITLHYIT